jgi:AcrR family transcriptional regulator
MSDSGTAGRANQRRRTRKDLLEAAARLTKQGLRPTLEEIAEEAFVSRATAYRYFSGVEALLLEAALDVAVPDPVALFADEASNDPVVRLGRVDSAMEEMMAANEGALRTMLIHSLERRLQGDDAEALAARQNRRTPLIEAALAPAQDRFDRDSAEALVRSLALIIGTEAMVVFKDVLQLDAEEARRVRRWAIRALVEAALKPDRSGKRA